MPARAPTPRRASPPWAATEGSAQRSGWVSARPARRIAPAERAIVRLPVGSACSSYLYMDISGKFRGTFTFYRGGNGLSGDLADPSAQILPASRFSPQSHVLPYQVRIRSGTAYQGLSWPPGIHWHAGQPAGRIQPPHGRAGPAKSPAVPSQLAAGLRGRSASAAGPQPGCPPAPGVRCARPDRRRPPGRPRGRCRTDGRAALGRRLSLIAVPADPIGAPAEQRDRAAGITPVRVRQPDRDLGQALPEIAFGGRSGLPRRLEDLVGVKRAAIAQQLIRRAWPRRAGQGEVVRDPRPGRPSAAARASGRPSASRGPRVPRPARRVAIPRSTFRFRVGQPAEQLGVEGVRAVPRAGSARPRR